MVITVDKLSDAPLYLQLRDSVIAGIAAGELRPGDALPSVRSLAEDLGINLHTVNKAYATLRDEGYVIMLGRRGAYVADAPARSRRRHGRGRPRGVPRQARHRVQGERRHARGVPRRRGARRTGPGLGSEHVP